LEINRSVGLVGSVADAGNIENKQKLADTKESRMAMNEL
jgi:hypothetical protein